jgi:aryl-alcohol dehydrogenase-like predicted oxidoreductase
MIEPRTLGSSDLVVPAVGMGCNNFSRQGTATETQEGSTAVIHAAIDHGITFFDGADIYGAEPGLSETFMGVALAGRRDEVVLATKFGHSGATMPGSEDWGPKGAARYIRGAVEASLIRLRTDRIDLLQMHTPDPATPIEETLAALTDLVAEGKVRYVGNSNFSAGQLREADRLAQENGLVPFISAQNEYSLLARGVEEEVLPAVRELGLGFIPYFPLHNGLLTGKYTRAGGEGRISKLKPQLLETVDWDQLEAYRRLCAAHGLTMLEATFGWLLAQEGVATVIAGATTPEQVAQNAAAGGVVIPDDLAGEIGDLFAR